MLYSSTFSNGSNLYPLVVLAHVHLNNLYKEIKYITVTKGAIISCNYTACHLLSIKRIIMIHTKKK